jgi:hypothetical protein
MHIFTFKLSKKVLLLLFCKLIVFNAIAQSPRTRDSVTLKHVNNLVPRLGLGMSRHFITEIGIAYMKSHFASSSNSFNCNNIIYYLSLETLTPYKKPIVKAYKLGIESINFGHITSAGGVELGYYEKDTLNSLVLTPRIGIPLMNGTLAYGFSMYFNKDMRKEVGRHRISLSYCLNRKSNRVLKAMP